MEELEKTNSSDLEKKIDLLSKYELDIKEGDIFFGRDDQLLKISSIKLSKIRRGDNEEDVLYVHYDESKDKGITWNSYGSSLLDTFLKDRDFIKLEKPLEDYLSEANKIINGEISLESYKDSSTLDFSSALVHVNSKENLVALQAGLKEKQRHVQLVEASIRFEMEVRRKQLDIIRRNLGDVVASFRKKVRKLEDVIWMIELYLGVNEHILHIREGKSASESEIIYFRQQVLFMDEEVGDPEDDGIDFKNIDQFDEWISNNFNKIIPESKSVVVFKVRRSEKQYIDNPFINSMLNQNNKKTYVLIKNGDNLYRVWGDITMNDRLFPRKSEFMEMQAKILEEVERYGESWAERMNSDFEDTITKYQRQLVLLQGLFDRTEVFSPYGERMNLLSSDIHESGRVHFIYDDEIKLPDSRLPFWDWHKRVNECIQEGDRIILSGRYFVDGYRISSDFKERFDSRFWNEVPDLPSAGLYTVELFWKEVRERVLIDNPNFDSTKPRSWNNREHIDKLDEEGNPVYNEYWDKKEVIRYNPGDTIYNLWSDYSDRHERKVRLSFKIFKYDKFLINFDNVSLEDVDFYLNSRVNRREYLFMMPLLYKIKQLKIEERKEEEYFVLMMEGDLSKEYKGSDLNTSIWKAIGWWKLKNKWKRSLKSDDSKAYRMIRSRILNQH